MCNAGLIGLILTKMCCSHFISFQNNGSLPLHFVSVCVCVYRYSFAFNQFTLFVLLNDSVDFIFIVLFFSFLRYLFWLFWFFTNWNLLNWIVCVFCVCVCVCARVVCMCICSVLNWTHWNWFSSICKRPLLRSFVR